MISPATPGDTPSGHTHGSPWRLVSAIGRGNFGTQLSRSRSISSPGEALEGRRMGIDTQRNAIVVLLFQDEFVEFVWKDNITNERADELKCS